MADANVTFDVLARDRASATLKRIGNNTDSLSRKLGGVARVAKVAVTAFAGGAVVRAIARVGMEYQDSLNLFQAVTQATGNQMDAVADKAKELGANLTLPTTSAADAAAAMTELAKGGLGVRKSMDAALGTLQLAAAAQVDGAQAAQIQTAALSQFRLSAKSAGHVADILANSANAAQGEITDMATALTYVGPVAQAIGVNIDDTATAIALLAKNGILGDKAGTGLRGMLVSLEHPSSTAAAGLKRLGIEAFDSQGNFVGLRKIIDTLSDAQGRLTTKQFASAAAAAFGRTPLAAVSALAAEGATNFDKMAKAVGREGGAASVARAKTRGLRGALSGLQSQLETIAISIYEKVAPGIESGVRLISERILPALEEGFDRAKVALFGRNINALLEHQLGTGGPMPDTRGLVGRIIDSIKGALESGDWSQIGTTIADGFVAAITTTANLTLRVTEAFGRMLSRIDWVGLGVKVGKATLPFVAGVAAGIINYVGSPAMLSDIASHWQELLFAVIAVAFLPGKVVGFIGNTLRRIPLAGRLIAWAFEAFARLSKSVVGFVGRFFGRMAGAFLRELGIEGRKITGWFVDRIITPVYVHVDDWIKAGRGLVSGLGDGIEQRVGWLGGRVKDVIKAILKPFANAGRLLYDVGAKIIGGLWDGIKSGFGKIEDGLGWLTNKITDWKGPADKDKKLLRPAGQMIMDGLLQGLEDRKAALQRALASVTNRLASVQGAARSLAQGVRSSLSGTFDLSSATNLSAGGIQSFLSGGVAQVQQFVHLLSRLIKRGLPSTLVQQIAAMGPGAGTAAARNLLNAPKSQFRQISRLERQLQAAATRAGSLVADQRYGDQIDELKKTRKQTHDDLVSVRRAIHELREMIDAATRNAHHKSTARTA